MRCRDIKISIWILGALLIFIQTFTECSANDASRTGRPAATRTEPWQTVQLRRRVASDLITSCAELASKGITIQSVVEMDQNVRMEGYLNSEKAVNELKKYLKSSSVFLAPEVNVTKDRGSGKYSFVARTFVEPSSVIDGTANTAVLAEGRNSGSAHYIDKVLGDINERALSQGLGFERFKPVQAMKRTGYVALLIQFIVSGDYNGMKNFVRELENTSYLVALHNIELQSKHSRLGDLQLTADLIVYLKE